MNEHNFSKLYFQTREKENRIYSDEEVAMLPFVKRDHPHFKEWEVRKNSFKKLRIDLQNKNKPFHILDIGCGNGWMSNLLSEINDSTVIGIDPNDFEIEQAKRVFKENGRVRYFCDDVLQTRFTGSELFDIIVMAASVQYFPDFKILIERLSGMLKPDGEIHLLDSRFYDEGNIARAKESSRLYYERVGYTEMANHYYHHRWSDLSTFNFEIRNRSMFQRFLLKIFNTRMNYFPWIIIKK